MTGADNENSSVPDSGKGRRRRWLWQLPLGIGGVFVLAAFVAFVLWPAQSLYFLISLVLFSGRPDVPDPEFYFQVQADLVFDGEPAVIDGWVACRGRIVKYPGEQHWRTNWRLSAQFIGTRLESGGAIYMGIPGSSGLCYLTVSGSPVRDNWHVSGEHIPAEILPEFFWIDDIDRPAKGEIYASEDYYARADARLEIKSFRINDFGKTLPEDALLLDHQKLLPRSARALASANGRVRIDTGEHYFKGAVMRNVPFDDWRHIPELVAFAERQDEQQEIAPLNGDTLSAAWPLRRLPTGTTSYRLGFSGIPRRHVEDGALISVSPKRVPAILAALDNVTPMACDQGWATPLRARSGYWPICAFPLSDQSGVKGVVYKGQRFESPQGISLDLVLYDPQERALIIFDNVGV